VTNILSDCNQFLSAFNLTNSDEGYKVLEAGGGSATHFKLPPNAHVLALDIEFGQLVKNHQAHFKIQGDLHHLPLRENSVDMIICFNVIEHLDDPKTALDQLACALKPGGILVLGCPTRNSLKGIVTRITPIEFHRWYYKNIVQKKDRGDGHYDAFPTPFRKIVSPTPLKQWLQEQNFQTLYFKTYDGAKAYQISTGSLLKNVFCAPYYMMTTLGRLITLDHWQAQNSDLLLVAQKAVAQPAAPVSTQGIPNMSIQAGSAANNIHSKNNHSPLNANLQPYLDRFQCPKCLSSTPLVLNGDELVCQCCSSRYNIDHGCPVLLSQSSINDSQKELNTEYGKSMTQEYEHIRQASYNKTVKRQSSRLNQLKKMLVKVIRPPEIMYHFNPKLSKRIDTWSVFTHQGQNTKVLNLGGGPTRFSDKEVTLNISQFHNVDCVGDGHNIPFLDNTFDSIICNAVLEHVHSPEQVVSEMIRVLKPGGKLYAEVPFIFFFHGYPNDFRRYTLEGMKYLFRQLKEPTYGMTHGPISGFLQTGNCLIDILIPSKYPKVKKGFNGIYRWSFFVFKYLDLLLKNRSRAHLIAGGFWVLGTKQPQEAGFEKTSNADSARQNVQTKVTEPL